MSRSAEGLRFRGAAMFCAGGFLAGDLIGRVLSAGSSASAAPLQTSAPALIDFGPINSLIGFGTGQIFSDLSHWIVQDAVGVFDAALAAATGTTSPNLSAQWFAGHYATMLALAGLTVIPLLLACTISAVIRQDPMRLVRAVFLQLPLAGLGTVFGLELTQRLVDLVDLLCRAVWPSPASDLAGIGQNLVGAKGVGAALVAGLLAIAALTLWLELALRQAAIYATALLLPLFLAGLVWPATVRYAKRAAETSQRHRPPSWLDERMRSIWRDTLVRRHRVEATSNAAAQTTSEVNSRSSRRR